MLVTLFGIVTSVRLLQYEKAYSPMLVTPSGIVAFVRLLQYEKAIAPISVTGLPPSSDGMTRLSAEPV